MADHLRSSPIWVALFAACFIAPGLAQDAPRTTAWTQSRIKGTPEAPLPLALQPAFAKLKFQDPMHIRWQADAGRYFVCELGSKIWSFPHDEQVEAADLVVDLKQALKSFDPARSTGCENVYSIAFDPDFKSNRFIYICMLLGNKTGKPMEDASRISRFVVSDTNPPTIDVASELKIITWLGGGHNGADMAFDNSGCLLFSTGDAADPAPPDRLSTGQDCSDLLASVLRVDVRGATADKPYKIPDDNPFLNLPNVRPEIWAFGFRNPWRIAIDPPTGQLWLGDVGWEKWEMVHHVVRGGNYGWSIREAHELLRPDVPLGPSPILPTRVTMSHADSASVTGGFVYRGRALPKLVGQYIFGDWVNGRIWSVPLDDHSPHVEIASGQLRIIAFAPDRDGEPLVVNHLAGTTMFRIVPNENYAAELAASREFPHRLSQTGLFADTAQQTAAPGVRTFTINQPQWQDGAVGQHLLALPDKSHVTVFNEPQPVDVLAMFNSRLHYPAGAVLAKTITMPANGRSGAKRDTRIETQLLHFDGRLWRGYTYLWNAEQTDAELVDAAGAEITLPGTAGQRWRVHSRTECMQCHNPWPETTLAFSPEQLHQPQASQESEWIKLVKEGLVVTQDSQRKPIDPVRCVRNPLVALTSDDEMVAARSYLHVNCSHCHQFGAGAGVEVSLRFQDEPGKMKAVDVVPSKGGFGIEGAKIISTVKPSQSSLLYRMASSSAGRMPHIGSREVDFAAVAMVNDWLNTLSAKKDSSDSAGPKKFSLASLDGRAQMVNAMQALADQKDSPAERSQRLEAALELAVDLAKVWHVSRSAGDAYENPAWVAQLAASKDPLVSSLFEAFLPAHQRQRRLGPTASYSDVADMEGDPARGQQFFFDEARSQCSKCHRVGERGGQVGPALSDIGKRQSPAQIFESIMDPNRVIEAKFQTHIVVTDDGKSISGLLISETPQSLTLVDAKGQQFVVPVSSIESRKLDTKSLMPTGLANELTAQQAADLLAYLSSLK